MPKQNGSRGRTVVITQGSAATVVAVNGKVTLYPVIALPADKLVDTNGAGAWCCVLCWIRLRL
jgi:adenosine kinase